MSYMIECNIEDIIIVQLFGRRQLRYWLAHNQRDLLFGNAAMRTQRHIEARQIVT